MYANFFPGSTRDTRELSINAHDAYAIEDLRGFVDSIIKGCTSSLYIAKDGQEGDLKSLKEALEDVEVMIQWFGPQDDEDETEEQRAQREAVEELHALFVEALAKP